MMKACKCGSYAINHHCHGRDGSDDDLCDVCYWRKRAEQPAQQQEPVAWMNILEDGYKCLTHNPIPNWTPLYTSPQPQRKPLTDWIDPNDKTQKQYLPHIGEPVLFCNNGMTYMGKHTGGSFQSEVTNQYFNTWECQWMYLPAAHGIKENT